MAKFMEHSSIEFCNLTGPISELPTITLWV